MKLTVDIDLTSQILTTTQSEQASLAYFLSRASIQTIEAPLESWVATSYGLTASPDYPIAAIAANVDGLNVETYYWFRAQPVFLVMQRDTFSMGDQVPLLLSNEESLGLIEALNAHFSADGILFEVGISGAWYLKVPHDYHALPVETVLPAAVMHKNIAQFMPKGQSANYWISLQNEIQMLLFGHSVNQARESGGQLPVNSVWFSGGGQLPAIDHQLPPLNTIMLAKSPFYEGLATVANMNFAALDIYGAVASFERLINESNQDVRLKIESGQAIQQWFDCFAGLVKAKKVSVLDLNVGWYDMTFSAQIKPIDLRKFWRKIKPLNTWLK